MKIAATIARILLGVIFIFFGSNILFPFLPHPPMPPGPMADYSNALLVTHYILPIGIIQVVCGILFLFNRFVPLALTMIAPVIVNILLFHATMAPSGIGPGLLVTVLWFVVFYRDRSAFYGLFQAKVEN
jgi:putative oxidoreductase